MDSTNREAWVRLASLADLETKGCLLARHDAKRIALFAVSGQIVACNNRCPHEGYPLIEGVMAADCVLTCNWHNWKFDLKSGATLVGGDALRTYPVRLDGDDVLVDIADPRPDTVVRDALAGLADSFERHEYERMAREIARLGAAGGDPLEALRQTIRATHEHFEYGATHAVPAAADWLALRTEMAGDEGAALATLTEAVAHFAWDSQRQLAHPFTDDVREFGAGALIDAIEIEDEPAAVAQVRGAFAGGLGYADLKPALARTALAHYQDFGHSLIYVEKAGDLLASLGEDQGIGEAVSLMLVRSLVYASREDLIPEFKSYAPALAEWNGKGWKAPRPEDLRAGRLSTILGHMTAGSAGPLAVYDAAMQAAAWQMLHYDMNYQDRTTGPVSQNVGWLSFTHALTFGNAVRRACADQPDLWPAGLLQLGCFLGRNAAFVDADQDTDGWQVVEPLAFVGDRKRALVDHGEFEYIVACHLLKLSSALEEEFRARDSVPWAATAAAALNRFLASPLKRKHALRAANQALEFVRADG